VPARRHAGAGAQRPVVTCQGDGTGIVEKDDGLSPASPRPVHEDIHQGAERETVPSLSVPTDRCAGPPVHGSKEMPFAIGPQGRDLPLPPRRVQQRVKVGSRASSVSSSTYRSTRGGGLILSASARALLPRTADRGEPDAGRSTSDVAEHSRADADNGEPARR
jgi:hypothetical protein